MVQVCSRLRAKEKGLENRLLFLLFGEEPYFPSTCVTFVLINTLFKNFDLKKSKLC